MIRRGSPMQLFLTAFESVPDPRAENSRHDLIEILLIAFLAVLCGAQHCSEMAEFGSAKLKFLRRFLKLRHGIPSHDTFSTLLRMIDPKALDAAFGRLTATLVAALAKGGVIAIDGKSLKGAYEKGEKSSPRMMVTADALHCNRRMVEAIIEKGGDYCIALKGNQDSLLSDARACLAQADDPKSKKKYPVAKTEDSEHGRSETRTAVVVEAKGLAEHHEFLGLTAFGRIEATRVIDGKT